MNIFSQFLFFQLILNGEKLPDPNKTKTPKLKKKKVAKPDFDELSKDSLFIDDQTFSKVITTSASRKKRDKGEKGLTLDQLNIRRKRLWMAIIRKEIGKAHKSRNFNIREKMTNGKRVATQCMRAVRQKAMISQRVAKETVWRAKRLTREMQVITDHIEILPSFIKPSCILVSEYCENMLYKICLFLKFLSAPLIMSLFESVNEEYGLSSNCTFENKDYHAKRCELGISNLLTKIFLNKLARE